MAKEKNFNPVQAQRKKEKAREIKKGKAQVQDRRNEKLARKNPERLQKQIDDLKAITTNGGKLSKVEEQMLEGLEKELKAVRRARDTLGDKAPTFGRGWNKDRESGGVLGKRRRGSQGASSDDDDIPDDVRKIPMPRDTPPPIPKEVMDEWWAKRRARRAAQNPNEIEVEEEKNKKREKTAPEETKTVYEAKPVTRNLQQEAVSAFIPAAVRAKMSRAKGQDGLMDPEEADRLEHQGYLKPGDAADETPGGGQEPDSGAAAQHPRAVMMEEVEDEEGVYPALPTEAEVEAEVGQSPPPHRNLQASQSTVHQSTLLEGRKHLETASAQDYISLIDEGRVLEEKGLFLERIILDMSAYAPQLCGALSTSIKENPGGVDIDLHSPYAAKVGTRSRESKATRRIRSFHDHRIGQLYV